MTGSVVPPRRQAAQGAGPAVHVGAPRIVVLGMMAKMPVAGVVWQTIHYLEGFRRLGFDVQYVEAHSSTPRAFIQDREDDGAEAAAAFLSWAMGLFGFGSRWAYHARHSDGRYLGKSRIEVDALYASADLILNLHGGTIPLPEHRATSRLAFLCTDPTQLEIELFHGNERTKELLAKHDFHFTFGENYGAEDCGLPNSDLYRPTPTRQPVVMDYWRACPPDAKRAFTTVGNWRQEVRDLRYRGETYTWSKHHEFLKLIDLPQRTAARLELALSSLDPAERSRLEDRGWAVRDALAISRDPGRYRRYLHQSLGEFTVAKDQNVRLRSGWFSDRSACYLAAGRPVVTQDTGFGNVLPTGAGLFAFRSEDEAADALDRVLADPRGQAAAAKRVAEAWFAHDVVLPALLSAAGVSMPRASRSQRLGQGRPVSSTASCIPRDLVLAPVSRHPTTLPRETREAVLDGRLIESALPAPTSPEPRVSIVVLTHDQEVFSRLCLTSLLSNTGGGDIEILVVDNASTDGTREYLEGLAARHPSVRLISNDTNRGFAAANNQALREARGTILVLLNNDTIVPPGWLRRLVSHLDDPSVGAVGPVTNRIGNEAQIDVPYTTYGGFLSFAAERARSYAGESFTIPTLTMFCFAFRRDTWEEIGPLDERFGVGTLEDDDYSRRLDIAGLRRVCAEDVVVHHFGQASFGKLVRCGRYAELLRSNREAYADKWGQKWEPYARRPSRSYDAIVAGTRRMVDAYVPEESIVGVVSRGDPRLLELGAVRQGRHVPSDTDGTYSGHHPAGDAEAFEQISRLRMQGGSHLVIPHASAWWLDFYGGLAAYLDACSELVAFEAGVCRIFELGGAPPTPQSNQRRQKA